ncbi:ferredoxin [Amaricoccus sp.]|uniref:ferredoxin n=1 Tax=Amaricoccus sp. TaxID=1872485 RepID=UPI0025B7E7EC|nr:ferredoxin [Amaricoccus sp.]
MRWAGVAGAAAAEGLVAGGGLHPGPEDGAPEGTGTIVLLCPDGRGFWDRFRAGPEFGDGRPDPLDRWSRRVIGGLAARLGATALFPFGGPPWRPFTRWARASGMAWEAPVGLLVHARLGLFVSYRGALAFAARLDLPAPAARPCDACARPCLTACPAGAMTGAGYDIAACHGFLDGAEGADCLGRGCAVRRACPVGAGLRAAEQSAFHMASFHRG